MSEAFRCADLAREHAILKELAGHPRCCSAVEIAGWMRGHADGGGCKPPPEALLDAEEVGRALVGHKVPGLETL